MGGRGSGRRKSDKSGGGSQGTLVGAAGPVTNPLHGGSAFMVRADAVFVDGTLRAFKLGDPADPIKFSGTITLDVTSLEQAEAINTALPGMVERFVAASDKTTGEDAKLLHPKGQVTEQIGESGPVLSWTVVQLGELGPMDAPGCAVLAWSAPIRTLTGSGNNGTCTLTISVRGEIPVSQLPAAVALKGRRVRVSAFVPQAELPLQQPVDTNVGEPDFLDGGFSDEPETKPPGRPVDLDEELPEEAGT